MNISKEYIEAIIKNTELDSFEALMYTAFCDNADFNDGVIMFLNAEHDLQKIIETYIGIKINKDKRHEVYEYWEDFFKEKKLIETRITAGEQIYPFLIGYNIYNDPSIYASSRKIGTEEWTGRMHLGLFIPGSHEFIEPFHSTKHGYEFKDIIVKQITDN